MAESFEEQHTHVVQGIKFSEPQETMVEAKRREAHEIAHARYEAFSQWLSIQKNQEDFRLPTLIIPDELRWALVPPRVYELAHNLDNLELAISQQENEEGFESLHIMVVERNYPGQLTDINTWNTWLQHKKDAKRPGTFGLSPVAPQGIDRIHAKTSKLIEKGVFSIKDRVLFEVNLRMEKIHPKSLYVSHFESEKGNGIGSKFYLDVLPRLAKDLGYRFIAGGNNRQNIGFFIEKLGRKRGSEIKDDKINEFFSPTEDGDYSLLTVQFLYPEDMDKYIK